MILALRAGLADLRHPVAGRETERDFATYLLTLSAAAWVVLAVMSSRGMQMTSGTSRSGAGGMSGMSARAMTAMAGMTTSRHDTLTGLPAAFGMWGLMTAAMMLPTALPAIVYTGSRSLRWRRGRAMVLFAAGYVFAWIAAGVVVVPVAVLVPSTPVSLAAALGLAALWQVCPLHLRAFRACHRSRPLAPSGRAADWASLRFGVFNGRACVGACWALMLAASVAYAADIAWMVAVAGLVASEKFARRPRRTARQVGAAAGACAVIVLTVGLI